MDRSTRRNSLTGKIRIRMNAQSSCAGEFVHWHLADTDARWAHVDMAFPAVRNSRGTGYGVALLTQAVRDLAR